MYHCVIHVPICDPPLVASSDLFVEGEPIAIVE